MTLGDCRWLTEIDGRAPLAATPQRSTTMHELANALSVVKRTSADLAVDISYALREAGRPGVPPTVRAELEAISAHVQTINRTLTRLREQAE